MFAQFLVLLLQLLGISQQINQKVTKTAQETEAFRIQDLVTAIDQILNSGVYGSIALHNQLTTLQASVDALPDGSGPVTLPTIPPDGYGAPSSSTIAGDVWNYSASPLYSHAKNYLMIAGNWAAFNANLRYLGDECLYFQAVWHDTDWTGGATDDPPVFDPSDILGSEDILTCLTRQNPSFDVGWAFAPLGYVRLVGSFGTDVEEWQTTFDSGRFEELKALLFPSSPAGAIPIWPGIANVTLGTPVAITAALSITEPMNGVLVALTGTPPDKPKYVLGDRTATAHIGQIAFVTDNGDMEYPQNLSFAAEVYLPTSQVLAAGVRLRAVPGVSGTVTPWVAT